MFFGNILRSKDEFKFFSLVSFTEIDIAVSYHLVKDGIATFNRGVKIIERRIVIRAFRNTREHCAFAQIQIFDVLAEVSFSRRLHAVSTLPEINLVQIEFQNFLLGVLLFELERKENLLNFALISSVLREVSIFG